MQKPKTLISSSKEFRKFFLLKFTEQLIINSGAKEIFELRNVLKKQEQILEEQSKERVRGVIKKIEMKERGDEIFEKLIEKNKEAMKLTQLIGLIPSITKIRPPTQETQAIPSITKIQPQAKEIQTQMTQKPRMLNVFPTAHGVLRIPEIKLPPRLQYLRPYPTDIYVDLGKLNPLVDDISVSSIECHGPSENIIVAGKMGRKKTNIILSEGEINEIINRFSTTAKIPLQEGVFKVVLGKLIISAVISDIISTRFIIRKMNFLIPPPPSTFAR